MENLQREKEVFGQDPASRYHVEIEDMGTNVEGIYFWFIDFLRGDHPSGVGFHHLEKIRDITAATESSLYFGNIEQRKGIQQDRVSQYLATIGRMVKDLFQIVRELRIMDERLTYYNQSKERDRKGAYTPQAKTAEVSLKDMWVTMVEGGTQNPTSVYGMSQRVNFVTLPDLFFTVTPKSKETVSQEVDKNLKDFNETVRNALKRKLLQYMTWKEKTESEITTRRNFLVKYMRQHYATIKMYMSWVKPYLINVKKLQLNQDEHSELIPELVTGFDTSLMELELLAVQVSEKGFPKPYEQKDTKKRENVQKEAEASTTVYPCILLQIDHVTKPMMAFQQENQRSAIHAGKVIIHMKSYGLTYSQIQKYKKEVEMEDFELIGSIKESMTALKDEIEKYLEKEDPYLKKEESPKEKKKKEGMLGSFRKGVEKTFSFGSKNKKGSQWEVSKSKKKAEGIAKGSAWVVYDIFKKVHLLLSW